MINWRDIRSKSELEHFVAWFERQKWRVKEPILKEMQELLDTPVTLPGRDADEVSQELPLPHKRQRRPRRTRRR